MIFKHSIYSCLVGFHISEEVLKLLKSPTKMSNSSKPPCCSVHRSPALYQKLKLKPKTKTDYSGSKKLRGMGLISVYLDNALLSYGGC